MVIGLVTGGGGGGGKVIVRSAPDGSDKKKRSQFNQKQSWHNTYVIC